METKWTTRFAFLRMCSRALPVVLALSASAGELLNMDFDDEDNPGMQPSHLPAGVPMNGPAPSTEFPGSLDLGTSGYLRIPEFRSPQGPFSVEAHFLLRAYPKTDSRFIADIFNSASWDTVRTQGASLRIGGGDPYSILDRSAYESDEDYNTDKAWYADAPANPATACTGQFVIAAGSGPSTWKQVITDRCLPLDSWVHMVGVWDGDKMHLYVNGQYSVDTLRVLGKGASTRLATPVPAYVGARADGEFDPRHFHGLLNTVRLVDSAISRSEIRSLYRSARNWERADTSCQAVVLPVYPQPGQVLHARSTFRSLLVADGACRDPSFKPVLDEGDSLEVEISDHFGFNGRILASFRTSELFFRINPITTAALARYVGPAFWRARLVPAPSKSGLTKSAADKEKGWNLARPFVLNLAEPSPMPRPRARGKVLATPGARLRFPAGSASHPILWTAQGIRYRLNWKREGGLWTASVPAGGEAQVLIVDLP